ncbi:MAG: hypothetical protein O3B65_01035 [Chloroflexi bacterium]|nr:hypothetical protein [Chloroflexota bacterium]
MKDNPPLIIIAVIGVLVTGIADAVLIVSGKEAADVIGGTWVEFWAIFATVWNLVIIGFAKYVGERVLQKPSDYYGDIDG